MRINYIVFDFGGVLVQYDFTGYFERLTGSRERAEFIMHNILTEAVSDEMDRALRPFSFYLDRCKQQFPDYAHELDCFDRDYTDVFTCETPGMRQFMEQMKRKGYKLLGLSNWSARVYDVMRKFGIFSELDGYLLSKDVHQLKPEPGIYHSFYLKFGVDPAECVFIDDKPENVAGSIATGMPAIRFTSVEKLREELKGYL